MPSNKLDLSGYLIKDTGSPNGSVTGAIGDLYQDEVSAITYINVDGATNWFQLALIDPATGLNVSLDQLSNVDLASLTPTNKELLQFNGTAWVNADIGVYNEIYVASDGDDANGNGSANKPFLSLGAAITHINVLVPSIANQFIVKLSPGIFAEAPITVPEYVTIEGSRARTIITATDPNSDLFTLTANSTLLNLLLSSVTNAANYLVNVSSSATGLIGLQGLILASGVNGINATSSSGTVQVVVNECFSNGLTGSVIMAGSGSNVTIDSAFFIGNGVSTVCIVASGGDSTIYSAKAIACLSALDIISNDGEVHLYSLDGDSTTKPLRQTGTAKLFVNGGRVDLTQAEVIDTSVIDGFLYSEVEGENTLTVLSEFSVGVPGKGRESCFGEGDSYVNGMLVYTYDGATYTSVTADASSQESSTFTFPGTGIGNYIYVATAFPEAATGNPIKWFGNKVDIVTASVGGEIITEYWNGSAWTQFSNMSTESSGSYYPYGNLLFQRVGSEHVRFTDVIDADWATSDEPSVGINLYWIRYSISTALTTAPVFQQFKVHSNRTELNVGGFQEYFGKARPVNILNFTSNLFTASNASPANQDVYYANALSVGRVENNFQGSAVDRSGLCEVLPFDCDTSQPIRLKLYLIGTTAGPSTIDLQIRWAFNSEGAAIFRTSGAAPGTNGENLLNGTVATPANADEIFVESLDLDISNAITRRNGGVGDLLWLSIEREGQTDAYGGDIILVQVVLEYTSWCNGGHL